MKEETFWRSLNDKQNIIHCRFCGAELDIVAAVTVDAKSCPSCKKTLPELHRRTYLPVV